MLEGQFEAGKIGASRNGFIAALALVASGKPEHRELVREWVQPQGTELASEYCRQVGYQSARRVPELAMSFDGLDAAIYYDATGDDFVLPAIKATRSTRPRGRQAAVRGGIRSLADL